MKTILSAAALMAVVCACGATGGGPHGGGGGSGGDVGHGGGTSSSSASTSGGGDGSSGGSGAGTSTTSGTGGGATPECAADADCPGVITECRFPRCDAGNCVTYFPPAGTRLTEQVSGDCSTYECNGAGDLRRSPNAGDVSNDGNACTVDTCSGTTPTHTPSPDGGTCPGGRCVSGACADCIADADCGGRWCVSNTCVECVVGSTCPSGVCTGNVCQAPTCTDGVQNGAEWGVDCGSGCPGCPDGTRCAVGSDCIGELCSVGVCICNDHLLISEVQTGGDGGADDEFVEIYNPSESSLSLNRFIISQGADRLIGPITFTMAPHERRVYAGLGFHGGRSGTFPAGMHLQNAGHVKAWLEGSWTLDTLCYCHGDAQCATEPPPWCEGDRIRNPYPEIYADVSMARGVPGRSCTDTGNNATDFYVSNPSTPGM